MTLVLDAFEKFKLFLINPRNTIRDKNLSAANKIICAALIFPIIGFCIASLLWFIVLKLRDANLFTLIETDYNFHRGFLFNLLITVLLTPFLEEGLFRYPLKFIPKKKYYNLLIYLITCLFGAIHFVNYDTNLAGKLCWFLIVSPQLFVGLVFAFVRINFGFKYVLVTHSIYNLLGFSWLYFV
jgi:Na+/phosphate symporter